MITTNTMYELHTISTEVKLNNIKIEIEDTQRLLDKIYSYFEENTLLRPRGCSMVSIKTGKGLEIGYPFTNPEKYYNLQLNQYSVLYKRLLQKKEEFIVLSKHKVPKRIFAFILRRFNELLIEELIFNSYKLKDLYLGELKVIVNKGKKAVINWGISLKAKKEIEDRGGIPYINAEAEEYVKLGTEYKGERWITFLPEYRMFYSWQSGPVAKIRLPNITNFHFFPLRGDNSAVSMLFDVSNRLSQEELVLIYKNQNNAN